MRWNLRMHATLKSLGSPPTPPEAAAVLDHWSPEAWQRGREEEGCSAGERERERRSHLEGLGHSRSAMERHVGQGIGKETHTGAPWTQGAWGKR